MSGAFERTLKIYVILKKKRSLGDLNFNLNVFFRRICLESSYFTGLFMESKFHH